MLLRRYLFQGVDFTGNESLSSATALSVTAGDIDILNSVINLESSDINLVSLKSTPSIGVDIDKEQAANWEGQGGAVTIENELSFSQAVTETTGEAPQAVIETSGENPGEIEIFAGSLLMTNASIFSDTKGDGDGKGIYIGLKNNLRMEGGSRITTDAVSGIGMGGDIDIAANEIRINGVNSLVASNNRSAGGGGQVTVRSNVIILENEAAISAISTGSGNSGGIDLTVRELSVTSGAEIRGETLLSGKGADITVVASESVSLDGMSFNGNTGISVSAATAFGIGGSSGNIAIAAPSLLISNAAILAKSIFPSSGAAGGIRLDVQSLDTDASAVISSSTASAADAGQIDIVSTQVNHRGVLSADTSRGGGAGDINLRSQSALISGEISGFTSGIGQAGNLILNVDELMIDGGLLDSSTEGSGAAGEITIRSSDLSLSNSAKLNSSVFLESPGQGGSINIDVDGPLLVDNSTITASTDGFGNGGLITISAGDLLLTNNGVLAAATSAAGNGGGIVVDTNSLLIDKGAKVTTDSTGSGAAGAISLRVSQDLNLQDQDSSISSTTSGDGLGGNIFASARSINLGNDATITSASTGNRFAGNIDLEALRNVDVINARVLTNSEASGGGSISVNTVNRLYLNSAVLSASARGISQGDDGGNVTIDPTFILLSNSNIVAQAIGGDGGIIQLDSEIYLSDINSLTSATSELGNDGEVRISAPDNSVTGILGVLQAEFYAESRLINAPCAAIAFQERSSLVIVLPSIDGIAPDDLIILRDRACSQ